LRVFSRVGDRVTIPATTPSRIALGPRAERVRSTTLHAAQTGRHSELEGIGAFVMSSAVGYIAADEHYHILTINPTARRMLDINGIGLGEDLIHILPDAAAASVRVALDAALRNECASPTTVEVAIPDDDQSLRHLSVTAYEKREADDAGVARAVLLIVDVTDAVAGRLAAEAQSSANHDDLMRLRENALHEHERQRLLRDANAKLAAANTELRSRADAMLLGTEEATSASEELETLNEELQAGNEELETLNEEFQATIEELNATNDDLEARNAQLQELLVATEVGNSACLEARRVLQAVIDARSGPLAVFDANGDLTAKNRAFAHLMERAGTPALCEIDGAATTLADLVQRTKEGSRTFDCRVADPNGERCYRGTVSRLDDERDGSVLVLIDVLQ
jgi:two-component system CheB/CheR fusion protein